MGALAKFFQLEIRPRFEVHKTIKMNLKSVFSTHKNPIYTFQNTSYIFQLDGKEKCLET